MDGEETAREGEREAQRQSVERGVTILASLTLRGELGVLG